MQNTTTSVESLVVTRRPTVGDVLTCVTAAGRCEWVTGGGGGGGGENGAYATNSAGTPLSSNTTVVGTGSFVVVAGENSSAGGATGDSSVCLGADSSTSGLRATVAGVHCAAPGAQAVAGGQDSTATGDGSIALGYTVTAGGDGDVCIGNSISTAQLSTDPAENVAVGISIGPGVGGAASGGQRNTYIGAYIQPHNATTVNQESGNIYIGRDVNDSVGVGEFGTSDNINVGLFNVTHEVGATPGVSNRDGVAVGSYNTVNQGQNDRTTTVLGTLFTCEFSEADPDVASAVLVGNGQNIIGVANVGRSGDPFPTVVSGYNNAVSLGNTVIGNSNGTTSMDGGLIVGKNFQWGTSPPIPYGQLILLGRGETPMNQPVGIVVGSSLEAPSSGIIATSYNDHFFINQSTPSTPFSQVAEGSGLIDNGLPSAVITTDTTLTPTDISPGNIILLGGSKTLISPGDSATPAYLTLTLPSQAAMEAHFTVTASNPLDFATAEKNWTFYVRNTSSTYAYIPATDQFDVGVWQLQLGAGWSMRPVSGTSLCIMPESTVEFMCGKLAASNSFFMQRLTPLTNPFVCSSATDIDGTVNDSAGTMCTVSSAGTPAAQVVGVVGGGVASGVARLTATAQYVLTAAPGKTPFLVGLATLTVFSAFRMTFTVSSPIYLPLTNVTPGSYNFNVDWGDFTSQNVTTSGTVVHNYGAPGTYNVVCSGTLNGITLEFPAQSLTAFLSDITEWGPGKLIGTAWLRGQSLLLTLSATDAPDLSLVTDGANAFQDCASLATAPNFSTWPLLPGTDRTEMFRGCSVFNDQVYPNLLTGATSLSGVFQDCAAFDNGGVSMAPIAVAAGCDFSSAFEGASAYNQFPPTAPSPGPDMSRVFAFASAFNRNLGTSFVTSGVTTTNAMFAGAGSYDNGASNDMGSWDVSGVTNMDDMFQFCTSFARRIFGSGAGFWAPSSATSCVGTFLGCSAFNNGGFSMQGSVLPAGANLSFMFNGCSSLNVLPPTCLGVANATGTFAGCTSLNVAGIETVLTTSGCTSFQATFSGASAYNQNLGTGFVTASATTLQSMFEGATSYNNGGSADISSWDTSATTNTQQCFFGASAFDQPLMTLSAWDLTAITNCADMFNGATGFDNGGQPVVVDFGISSAARSIDATRMFTGCSSMAQPVTLVYPTTVGAQVLCEDIFDSCTLFDSNIGSTDVRNLQLPGFSSFQGTSWSQANFDLTVEAWGFTQSATTPTGPYVIDVTGLGITVPAGGNALTGFTTLVTTKGWIIIGIVPSEFITTWQQTPTNFVLTMPLTGTYSVSVDWGDGGGFEPLTSTPPTHTYAPATAVRTVRMQMVGVTRPAFSMNLNPLPLRDMGLLTVEQWGGILIAAGNAWLSAATLTAINASDVPNLTGITSCHTAFNNTPLVTFNAMELWVIPPGLSMERCFAEACRLTRDFPPSWINSPTTCYGMFRNNSNNPFFNCTFAGVVIPGSVDVTYMFERCTGFNQVPPMLTSPTSLEGFFLFCQSFNSPLGWTQSVTANVTSFAIMFGGCTAYNQDPEAAFTGGTFVTSVATSMASMFGLCTAFTGTPAMGSWDTSNVTDFNGVLSTTSSFNQNILGTGKWNLRKGTNYNAMFARALAFNNGGVAINLDLDASYNRAIDMTTMFRFCGLSVSVLDSFPSGVGTTITMRLMFADCPNFTGSGFSGTFVNSRVTNMQSMFAASTNFVGNSNMLSWDVSNVTDFGIGVVEVGGTFSFTKFNQPVLRAALPNWRAGVEAAPDSGGMFLGASLFNNGGQQVVFKPTTTSPKNCSGMLAGTIVVDADLDFGDVPPGTAGTVNAGGILGGVNNVFNSSLSNCHIDRVLTGQGGLGIASAALTTANFQVFITIWGDTRLAQAPLNGLITALGVSESALNPTAAAAVTALRSTKGWTINLGV